MSQLTRVFIPRMHSLGGENRPLRRNTVFAVARILSMPIFGTGSLFVYGFRGKARPREHRGNAAGTLQLGPFEKGSIGHILPIFNTVILNLEPYQCSATSSNLKSISLDNFLKTAKMVRIKYFHGFIALEVVCGTKGCLQGPTWGVVTGIPIQTIYKGAQVWRCMTWHIPVEI